MPGLQSYFVAPKCISPNTGHPFVAEKPSLNCKHLFYSKIEEINPCHGVELVKWTQINVFVHDAHTRQTSLIHLFNHIRIDTFKALLYSGSYHWVENQSRLSWFVMVWIRHSLPRLMCATLVPSGVTILRGAVWRNWN